MKSTTTGSSKGKSRGAVGKTSGSTTSVMKSNVASGETIVKQSTLSEIMNPDNCEAEQLSHDPSPGNLQVSGSLPNNISIGAGADDSAVNTEESNYGSFPSFQFATPSSSTGDSTTTTSSTAMSAPTATTIGTNTTNWLDPVLHDLTTPSPSSSVSNLRNPSQAPVFLHAKSFPTSEAPIKNESEDIFRDCASNLHTALPSINSNGKDWVDMGRDGLYTGIMLAMPTQSYKRTPRPLTLVGCVISSYLASPSTLNSGPSGWSITVGISEATFQDLFHLVNTCSRKVRIRKDGQTNFFVPFRMIDGRYELKLRAKVSYFEALRVTTIRDEIERSKSALRQIAKDAIGPTSSSNTSKVSATTFASSSEIDISSSDDDEGLDGTDLTTIEPKDWTSCPFPNIFDSTELPPSPTSEFVPTSYTDIVPRSLVAVRFHSQFWDFGVDGKQKTGYSLLLESLHLLNYSSDHHSDLQPKSVKKRPHHYMSPEMSSDRTISGSKFVDGSSSSSSKRRAKGVTPAYRKSTYLDL